MAIIRGSSRLLFFSISFILIQLGRPSRAQQANLLYNVCSSSGNYSSNSTYRANLNTLLSSISNNTEIDYGFYNFSAGENSNKVNAIALCRGDISKEKCRSLVSYSTTDITQLCPNQKEAIVWYDGLMLRYSNRSIFRTVERRTFSMLNTNSIANSSLNQFLTELGNLMGDLRSRAASGTSLRKFATGEANFGYNKTIYGLVQCTPDLSQIQCNNCLADAISHIPVCCYGKQGGRVIGPSCNLNYEIYPFIESTVGDAPSPSPAPSPSSPPRTNTTATTGKEKFSTKKIIAIVVPIVVALVLFFTLCFCFQRRERRKKHDAVIEENAGNDITDPESLQYDLSTIQAATRNFSDENKIGEGGFGDVYKGLLSNGQEIAVKRLSRDSGQGAEEFKNEIVLVAKLQHRNLVRVLGFCLEDEEKILIYEFVPNKSLDCFLFDSEKQGQLDWSRRYKIIHGIARGILYLHEDSRLRIIHRDLKASNVLLDGDMNAKISDFGMARIFGVDQTQGSTSRIVGTYGYMSPEYAMQGQFSVKSDVYSFGVLLLEIISSKKNSSFYQSGYAEDLLSYAWKLWRDGTPLELLDPTLKDSYSRNEVIRCIHIGLLCVQEALADRPTMASVVLMLNSFTTTLQSPKQPAFFARTRTESGFPIKELESDQSISKSIPCSVNEASISELYPR